MIFDYIIPMLSAFFTGDIVRIWWAPSIALAFVATVPRIFKAFWR